MHRQIPRDILQRFSAECDPCTENPGTQRKRSAAACFLDIASRPYNTLVLSEDCCSRSNGSAARGSARLQLSLNPVVGCGFWVGSLGAECRELVSTPRNALVGANGLEPCREVKPSLVHLGITLHIFS